MKELGEIEGMLAFQSKFGRGEWLRPYTIDVSEQILSHIGSKKNVAIVPVSFTSDHIETLFEVEEQYIKPIKEASVNAFRVPALNLRDDWIQSVVEIIKTNKTFYQTHDLIRVK